jgi:hypothetical protein
MATYTLQPGNHVIPYPESGRTQPDDLPPFLSTMEPSFQKLLAVHPHSRAKNPELVLEPSADSYRTSPRNMAFLTGRSINSARASGRMRNGS